MLVRSCRVTIRDSEGVTHTVEVTAATLYEAVAQGLAAIRGNDWVAGVALGLNVVKVSVADVRIEHDSEADGIYKMAGTRWRIAARNQRPERDSRNPGKVDATVEPAGR
jgi:hypothetical protein